MLYRLRVNLTLAAAPLLRDAHAPHKRLSSHPRLWGSFSEASPVADAGTVSVFIIVVVMLLPLCLVC